MKVSNLIILGPQGSGKTTQAELLAGRFGYALVSAGDVLREIAAQDSELGRRVRRIVNVEGRLVQPELISEVIQEKVATIPKDRGLILDGYPRSLTQYELFKKFWPETGRGDYKVIVIQVSDSEAAERLTRRVICESCGAVYIENRMKKCASCGGRLLKRPDDTPEAIETRLRSFYAETLPMIEAIQADGKVVRIDGSGGIDEVQQTIIANLD
jgi:adenylate kinase